MGARDSYCGAFFMAEMQRNNRDLRLEIKSTSLVHNYWGWVFPRCAMLRCLCNFLCKGCFCGLSFATVLYATSRDIRLLAQGHASMFGSSKRGLQTCPSCTDTRTKVVYIPCRLLQFYIDFSGCKQI